MYTYHHWQLLSIVNQTDRRLTAGVVNCCKWTLTVIKFSVPGGKYWTDFRYFRYLIVDIRYFSVLWIPTSVSVSVFQNTGYRFGISVYRPKTNVNCDVSYLHQAYSSSKRKSFLDWALWTCSGHNQRHPTRWWECSRNRD